MDVKRIVLGVGVIVAMTASTAMAATRHHHHRHHGYGAYAKYQGHRPTGPSNPNFELGGGWNNGSPGHPQYGRPDHN